MLTNEPVWSADRVCTHMLNGPLWKADAFLDNNKKLIHGCHYSILTLLSENHTFFIPLFWLKSYLFHTKFQKSLKKIIPWDENTTTNFKNQKDEIRMLVQSIHSHWKIYLFHIKLKIMYMDVIVPYKLCHLKHQKVQKLQYILRNHTFLKKSYPFHTYFWPKVWNSY